MILDVCIVWPNNDTDKKNQYDTNKIKKRENKGVTWKNALKH